MLSDLLIIMARYPTRGKVKTRLAAEIGHGAATELYRSFLTHHVREFRHAPFDVEWRYTPARANFRRIIGRNGFLAAPQPTGDLGERMQRIFEESFARGYRRVVMIGTDAPEMRQRTVRRAFRSLATHAAVFQPTHDGGYALIGLAVGRARPLGATQSDQDGRPGGQCLPDIFSGIAWSTHKVMGQTRGRLRKLRMSFAELPATFDVDVVADLRNLRVFTGE
jgi:rSAM/selenodomain-associated transferase 1